MQAAPATLDPQQKSTWFKSLAAYATFALLLCLCQWQVVQVMVQTWLNSNAYSHGVVVVPIALWLAWRKRAWLIQESPQPNLLAAVLMLPLVLGMWLSQWVFINTLAQFALVGLLMLGAWAFFGWRVVRHILFPIGFLLFAVPFGDFMLPTLMQWTADFTVWAVRASGVPVYREGLNFVIPTGRWSVVEACSGVRYLVASLMVGSLFAYMTYQSWRRRAGFMLAALLVPIVANWLRAYMIVMLGHLSNNVIATGVDHLIYGWVFFGLVMMLLFWVGMRWAEDEPAGPVFKAQPALQGEHRGLLVVTGIALALLLVQPLATHLLMSSSASAAPLNLESTLLTALPIGAQTHTPSDGYEPAFTESTDVLRQNIVLPGARDTVGLYVAMYREQDNKRRAVSSSNQIVASENANWHVTSESMQRIEVAGHAIQAKTYIVNGGYTRILLTRWYWHPGESSGQMTGSDIEAKLQLLQNRLAGRGQAGAAIVMWVPFDDSTPEHEAAAHTALAQAVQQIAPAISQTLQQAVRDASQAEPVGQAEKAAPTPVVK